MTGLTAWGGCRHSGPPFLLLLWLSYVIPNLDIQYIPFWDDVNRPLVKIPFRFIFSTMDTPLRRWRTAKCWTQAELAAHCGIKQNTISRYERAEHIPVRDHLEALISVTGLPTDALVRPEHFLEEHPDFLSLPPSEDPPRNTRPRKQR
jgi:hypothetical protein